MSTSSLLRMQWEGYARYHQSRCNLLLHIVFVPLFLASNLAFLVALFERRLLLAVGAGVLTGVAIAIQGRGHREEPVRPQPFVSPFNALSRIFLEQWVTFPRFVLSGAWMRAFRQRPTRGAMTTTTANHGTVLITGASSGIGRELALEFASRTQALVLVARRTERLERLRTELLARHSNLKVIALSADLSDEREIEALLRRVEEQVGPVDVLVNNAGLGYSALFDQSDWGRTRQLLHTNILAVIQLTSALVPGMVKRRRGGVINIGSGAGFTVLPSAASYVGSKHFIAGFSEALRADLAGTGVVVTQVCPGPVRSEFDEMAGSLGGMIGGLPNILRIGAAQCAREALAAFERGDARVYPGRAYRALMRILPLFPLWLRRRQAANGAIRTRARQS